MKKELQVELDELLKEINAKSYILNKKYSSGFLDGYKNCLEKHLHELDPEAIVQALTPPQDASKA